MPNRAYHFVLLLLPGWFRDEFAGEMSDVFQAMQREAAARGGLEPARLWLRTIADVAALGFRLHTETLVRDARYALRTLARTPAFTLAAIGTLAIGLGPTMVVANLAYRVVVAPLPFPDAGQIVRVWAGSPAMGRSQVPTSMPDYLDLRDGQSAFAALAAHTGTSVSLVTDGEPRQVTGVLTTAELHRVLGVTIRMGRGLEPADNAPGAPRVMVIGGALWRSQFGERPDVIGQSVRVDGAPTTIVGILEEGFDFPTGSMNAWLPLALDSSQYNRGSRFLTITGRLAPGVSIGQAEEALNAVARAVAAQYPDTSSGQVMEVVELKRQLNGDAPRLLGVLGGAIMAVLLIACLNVASLLAVRASARSSELAIRAALGATARRLRRQLLIEHIVLAFAGGAVAAALGFALHRAIVAERLLALPQTADEFGWAAMGILFSLVIAIGVVFARTTAWRTRVAAPAARLIGTARQTSGPSSIRLRSLLIAGEVAAALVLLVIASLMLRSALRLAAVEPGFRAEGVLTFGVVLPGSAYPEASQRVRFAERVAENLRALPGVRQVATAAYAPMGEMRATRRFAAADRALPPQGQEPMAIDLPVGPGYFEVMGIEIVEGRAFTDGDRADTPPVMVVSERFAREVFGTEPALGKRVRFYSGRPGGTPPPTREIVGVVRDVRQEHLARAPMAQMYSPYSQTAWAFLSFFVLSGGDAASLAPAAQRAVSQVDPGRPIRDVRTLEQIVRSSTDRPRAMTWMVLALAVMAIVLAAVGLYGVGAAVAAARTRELAIRAAVGADPQRLLRLVVGRAFVAAMAGVAIGAGASLVAAQALASFLYEVPPRDPVTIAGAAVLLLNIAVGSVWLPAIRNLRQNPADVLREPEQ
jgi:predicted permease